VHAMSTPCSAPHAAGAGIASRSGLVSVLHVQMQASFPSASASTHHDGAYSLAASGDRRRDPHLGVVVRHPYVEVDPVALRARRVHQLE
jgi:hypothetical protein